MVNITITKEFNSVWKELIKLKFIVDSNSARKQVPLQQLVYNVKELRKLGIFNYQIEDRV